MVNQKSWCALIVQGDIIALAFFLLVLCSDLHLSAPVVEINVAGPTPSAEWVESAALSYAAQEMREYSRSVGVEAEWFCWLTGHDITCQILRFEEGREFIRSSWYACPKWTLSNSFTGCMSASPGSTYGAVAVSGTWRKKWK